MLLCRNYSIAQALRLYKPPDLTTGHGGFCYAVFWRFCRHTNRRELLLRYQDKEERAPAALRLRGAGGSAPRLSARDSGPIAGCNGPRQARASAREGR